MSHWIQVNGEIEFEEKLSKLNIKKLRKILGTPTIARQRSVGDIPNGSEGSIQYTITKIRNNGGKFQTIVLIKGSLRDRYTEEFIESIRDWFKKIVYCNDFSINDFFLDISGLKYETIRYTDEDEFKYNPKFCSVCNKQLNDFDSYWSGECIDCQPLEGDE